MTLDWLSNYQTKVVRWRVLDSSSVAIVTLKYTPEQCIEFSVSFENPEPNKGVAVQAHFLVDERSGKSYQATKKVVFFGDNKIIGFGKTDRGTVKFRKKIAEIRDAQGIQLSVSSERK